MKLSVDRQEKKGFFGGTYYETVIRVTLTDEERKVAYGQGIMNAWLIGSNDVSSEETVNLLHLCNRSHLTMEDLIVGITAKANNESELGFLAWIENRVKDQCKNFKSHIETAINNKENMNQSFEEEI